MNQARQHVASKRENIRFVKVFNILDIEYIESDIESGKATCGKQERGFSRDGKSAFSL